jgi:hypothetical protein
VLVNGRCSKALPTAIELSGVGVLVSDVHESWCLHGTTKVVARFVLSALESSACPSYASHMRPSSRSSSPAPFYALAVLFLVVLPIAMIKFIGGEIAPDLVESVSERLRSYLAWASASMLGGVKGALGGLALLAVAIYVTCLLHSVMRGDRPAERHPKRRRIA